MIYLDAFAILRAAIQLHSADDEGFSRLCELLEIFYAKGEGALIHAQLTSTEG